MKKLALLPLIFLTGLSSGAVRPPDAYPLRVQQLRSLQVFQESHQEIEVLRKRMKAIDLQAQNLAQEAQDAGPIEVWSQRWRKNWQDSEQVMTQMQDRQDRLQSQLQELQIYPTATVASTQRVLKSEGASLERLEQEHARSWANNPMLTTSSSALDAARFLSGILMMERLTNLVEKQAVALSDDYLHLRFGFLSQGLEHQRILCQRITPELRRLPMASSDRESFTKRLNRLCQEEVESYGQQLADTRFVNTGRRRYLKEFFSNLPDCPDADAGCAKIKFIKNLDPSLATDGNLLTSFGIESILEIHQRTPLAFSQEDIEILQKPRAPKDQLQALSSLRRPLLALASNGQEWLQTAEFQGESSLDIGAGKTADCAAIARDFQDYIAAFESSAGILQHMIAIFDEFIAGRLNDAEFHAAYDPWETSYDELQVQMAALYPDENFERIHALRARWRNVRQPTSDARFVPWIVDYGPNSWNGSWLPGFADQDWYLSGPDYDATRGMQMAVKASVQDVCIDHRSIWVFGFWGDGSCSSGRCLFLKPGLSLRAGG